MKFFNKNVLGVVALSLMFCSTAVNILFYTNIISKGYVQIGFILVMLWSVLINVLSIKASKDKSGKCSCEKRSTVTILIAIIISISWLITYGMALFLK